MHAFLLIGSDKEKLKAKSKDLAKELHAKIMEFPLSKIDDTRSLNNLLRLSFKEPTLIVCQNIHEAGEEALNAFLKNLEEPQPNIYFALTAPSTRKVLTTIVSRCEVIRLKNSDLRIKNEEGEQFIKLTTGEKLSYIDKISKTSPGGVKGRDKAIELAESLVNFLHGGLHENDIKYSVQARNLESTSKTLSGLKANGNVNLQLTNLIVNFI